MQAPLRFSKENEKFVAAVYNKFVHVFYLFLIYDMIFGDMENI